VGVQTGDHRPWHAYRVVDSLAFPFISFDWTAEEEVALLEGLEAFGLSNWTDVADHVGTKTKTQCHVHYVERYLSSPSAPLPDLSVLIGKEGAAALVEAQDAIYFASLDPSVPAATDDAAQPSSGASRVALARAGIEAEAARSAQLLRFARPPEQEGGSVEVTGFNAKRAEFESEFDNEAELPLADLDFRKEDTDEERALKLRQVAIYNARLDERARRRAFCLQRGLLNVKRLQAMERRRAPEERELAAHCRWAARLQPQHSHDALMEGLACEARLRARVEELQEWRRSGVTLLAEGEAFEAERRRRAADAVRKRSVEQQATAEAAARAGASRAVRLLGREAAGGVAGASAVPPLAPPRELARLHTALSGALLSGPPVAPHGSWRRPRGTPLEIAGLPGLELLSTRERELCAQSCIVPITFLATKAALCRVALAEAPPGSAMPPALSKASARSLAGQDGSIVYDHLVASGVFREPEM
jgi:transcriptional adapter 2-alpha